MILISARLSERMRGVADRGGFSPEEVEALGHYVAGAPEEKLFRLNPYDYAREHGLAPHRAVDLLLHATHAGIFDFTWGLVCHACGSFLQTRAGLRSLQGSRHCKFCQLTVPASVDEHVEVAFTVTPAIRRIRFHSIEDSNYFGEDGPRLLFTSARSIPPEAWRAVVDSFLWSATIQSGESETVVLDLPEGKFRLNAPIVHQVARFSAGATGPSELSIDLLDGEIIPENGAEVKAGKVTLTVNNRTTRAALFTMGPDRKPPNRPTLARFFTGKELMTTQAFHELFRAESIPGSAGLEIKALTILFTDLKDSTQLYQRIGDLNAYDLVNRHFGLLRQVVGRRGGAIVKTIGDAIMASFAEPTAAVEAAVEMVRHIQGVGNELFLKVGVHEGACIAVELNERLDYFGQTVNIAARVQGLAASQEIVVTDPVMKAIQSAGVLQREGLTAKSEHASLKGVGAEVLVHRLHVA